MIATPPRYNRIFRSLPSPPEPIFFLFSCHGLRRGTNGLFSEAVLRVPPFFQWLYYLTVVLAARTFQKSVGRMGAVLPLLDWLVTEMKITILLGMLCACARARVVGVSVSG